MLYSEILLLVYQRLDPRELYFVFNFSISDIEKNQPAERRIDQ